jgi:hypothetical protein
MRVDATIYSICVTEAQARAAAKAGPRGAMNAFKKMDAATTPTGTGTKPKYVLPNK